MKLFSSKSSSRQPVKRSPAKTTGKTEPRVVQEPKKTKAKRADSVEDTRPVRQPKPQKPKKSGGKGKKIGLIAVACVAAVLVLTVALAVVVSGGDTIYNNVTAMGVDLSGLTEQEAAAKLERSGWVEICADGVTVNLPLEQSLFVSARDAGVLGTAEETAAAAMDLCHGNGLLGNFVFYVKCMFGGADITAELEMDDAAVRPLVAEAVDAIESKMGDSGVRIEEDRIEIVKGEGMLLSEEDIMALLEEAFAERAFKAVTYTPEFTGESTEIDFQKLYDEIFQEPVDAVYDKDTKGPTESQTGRSFDVDEAKRLWDAAQNGETVVIPLEIVEPEVSTEQLQEMLFRDELASKTTNLTYSAPRNNNITKAAAAMNGIVLNPGEEFSYNQTLGQRTAAAGYQAAGAYMNGEVVNEVGGGICQGSSTLYYCTLLANLKITSRLCHYFAVDYVPSGLDATVSWPSPDFKFVNNRDYPIKIEAYTDLSKYTLTVKIWGTDVDGSYVVMTTDGWTTSTGVGAISYRNVYDKDGKLISSTKESESFYHYHTEDNDPTPSPSATTPPTENPNVTTPPTQAPVVTDPPATQAPVVTDPPVIQTPPPVIQTPAPDPVVPVEPAA